MTLIIYETLPAECAMAAIGAVCSPGPAPATDVYNGHLTPTISITRWMIDNHFFPLEPGADSSSRPKAADGCEEPFEGRSQ